MIDLRLTLSTETTAHAPADSPAAAAPTALRVSLQELPAPSRLLAVEEVPPPLAAAAVAAVRQATGLLAAAAAAGGDAASPGALEEAGRVLGALLLPPGVRAALDGVLCGSGGGDPLRLHLGVGDAGVALPLRHAPWEIAVPGGPLGGESGWLGLHPRLRMVRECGENTGAHPAGAAAPRTAGPLRVLVVTADPADARRYPHLAGIGREVDSILWALRDAPEARRARFAVDVLAHATPAGLAARLRENGAPDVLHFIGHGEARPSGPALILERGDRAGASAAVYAEELAQWLTAAHASRAAENGGGRLAVFSCCGGGETARVLAEALLGTGDGIADVVAMQTPLRDRAARPFARAFYAALAEGEPPEECVYHAREAVHGMGRDWAAPVHYRRRAGPYGHTGSAPASPLARTGEAEPAPPGDDGTTDVVPPPAVDGFAGRGAVPADERPFIGREQAVRDVLTLLTGGGGSDTAAARLVTVTGIGGIGKSTLARRCARLLAQDAGGAYPDGVLYVELDALEDRDQIVSALAAVLGVRREHGPQAGAAAAGAAANDASGAADQERVCRALAGRRLLLMLDCFERHVASATDLVAALLAAAPGVRLLLTSRVALRLPQEYEYPLAPMEGSEGADAVALFLAAARHAAPGFAPDAPGVARAVGAICERLEGVPLSLVLAAGRLRMLQPEELLAHLNRQLLPLLRRRHTGFVGADRHAALRDVIAGSFALLPPPERRLLRQLALVFAGGCTVDDALRVCDAGLGGDVLEGLDVLRDHSLVRVVQQRPANESDDAGGAAAAPSPRLHVLDTIREYLGEDAGGSGEGAAEAEAELLEACRARHA